MKKSILALSLALALVGCGNDTTTTTTTNNTTLGYNDRVDCRLGAFSYRVTNGVGTQTIFIFNSDGTGSINGNPETMTVNFKWHIEDGEIVIKLNNKFVFIKDHGDFIDIDDHAEALIQYPAYLSSGIYNTH